MMKYNIFNFFRDFISPLRQNIFWINCLLLGNFVLTLQLPSNATVTAFVLVEQFVVP
jgi:hypothetical protein